MRKRLVLIDVAEIRGSKGEIRGAYVSEATALCLQTMAALGAGDMVEPQGSYCAVDGLLRR